MTAGIKVHQIDHVTIVVADLDATRRFYTDHLGMPQVQRPDFSFAGIWFQAGTTQIHATITHQEAGLPGWDDRGATHASRGHHFAFPVDCARSAHQYCLEQGIEIAAGPKLRPDGYVQVYVYDPDGHVVELFSSPESNRE